VKTTMKMILAAVHCR